MFVIVFRMLYMRFCKGVRFGTEEDDKDDISMDGETDDKNTRRMSLMDADKLDQMNRRQSLLDADTLEQIRAAQENELAEGRFVYEKRNRTETTDTMLTDYPPRSRPRADTADTMLDESDYPPRSRPRADTADTMLDESPFPMRKRFGTTDTELSDLAQYGEEDEVFSGVIVSPVLSKAIYELAYRDRSDTTDTMVSDAPMLGRGRTGTIDTLLSDSPVVPPRKPKQISNELETIVKQSPGILRKSGGNQAKESQPAKSERDSWTLFGKNMFNRTRAESGLDVVSTPGIFRKSYEGDVMVDMASIEPDKMRVDSDVLHSSPEHNRRKVFPPASSVEEAETDIDSIDASRRSSSNSSTIPLSAAIRQPSTLSNDTGYYSDGLSLSHRRRSLSLSSIETISAYVNHNENKEPNEAKIGGRTHSKSGDDNRMNTDLQDEKSTSVSDLEHGLSTRNGLDKRRASIMEYEAITKKGENAKDELAKSMTNPIHKLLSQNRSINSEPESSSPYPTQDQPKQEAMANGHV